MKTSSNIIIHLQTLSSTKQRLNFDLGIKLLLQFCNCLGEYGISLLDAKTENVQYINFRFKNNSVIILEYYCHGHLYLDSK